MTENKDALVDAQINTYIRQHRRVIEHENCSSCSVILITIVCAFLSLGSVGFKKSLNDVYRPLDDGTCSVYKSVDKCMMNCGCGSCADNSTNQCLSRAFDVCEPGFWRPSDNELCRFRHNYYSTMFDNISYALAAFAILWILLLLFTLYLGKLAATIDKRKRLLSATRSFDVVVEPVEPVEPVEMTHIETLIDEQPVDEHNADINTSLIMAKL